MASCIRKIFNFIFLFLLLGICNSLIVMAQEQSQSYLALKKYAREEIVPILKEQRADLDDVLSDEEKNEIKRMRFQFKQVMNMLGNEHISLKKVDEAEDMLFYFDDHQDVIEALMWDAWDIAEKYKAKINELLSSIQDEQRKWASDSKQILQRYGENEIDQEEEISWYQDDFNEIFIPTFFLLWSPEGLLFDLNEEDGKYEIQVDLFPNPQSGDAVELRFVAETPGVYQLAFINTAGRPSLTETINVTRPGELTNSVDISKLPAGSYYVRINHDQVAGFIRFRKI